MFILSKKDLGKLNKKIEHNVLKIKALNGRKDKDAHYERVMRGKEIKRLKQRIFFHNYCF